MYSNTKSVQQRDIFPSHKLNKVPLSCLTIALLIMLYLLFPVEATSVTVGYIDVAVRLEDCQLKTPQDAIEQLATGCLKTATQSVTSNTARGKQREPALI